MNSKLKRSYLEPTIYTAVCLLYLLRHILFGAYSVPGRLLYSVFFLWSLFYFALVALELRRAPYITMLNILVLLIFLYGFPLLVAGTDITWVRRTRSNYFLFIHFESILPIYSFYYFGKKQLIDDSWFRKVALFFFITVSILYEYNRIRHSAELGKEEVTNNAAYLVLSLYPIMVFFNKKPLIQYLGVFIMMVYLILGFKRGAILLGAICFLVLLWHTLRTSKITYKIVVILVVGIIMLYFIPFIENLLLNSEYFVKRVENTMEGNSSNRDVVYTSYWAYYCDQENLAALLFGRGAFSTIRFLGMMAHNDWLEILINMGLFGAFIYLAYWIVAIIMCKKSARRCRSEIYHGILFFIIIYLGKTVFSMSIMDMSFFATSVFGYLVAEYDNRKNKSLVS